MFTTSLSQACWALCSNGFGYASRIAQATRLQLGERCKTAVKCLETAVQLQRDVGRGKIEANTQEV